jgi:hypothetical protein
VDPIPSLESWHHSTLLVSLYWATVSFTVLGCVRYLLFKLSVIPVFAIPVQRSIFARGLLCKNVQVVRDLQTSCYKSVHKLSTSCVRTACSQLLEQAVIKQLVTSSMALSDLSQG